MRIFRKSALNGFYLKKSYYTIYSSWDVYIRKCKQIGILPLGQRFILNDMILFHKIVNHLLPIRLPCYLSLFSGNTRLRSSHLDRLCFVSSVLPRGNSTYNLNKSFFYRSHNKWNSVPLQLREIRESSKFKLKLKQYLWKCAIDDARDSEGMSNLSDTFDSIT